MAWVTTTATAGTCTGSISGTTLTVTAGTCQPGFILSGAGVTACTVIRQITPTTPNNGVGTYEVTGLAQTVPSTTITGTIRTHTQTGTEVGFSGLLGFVGVTKIYGAVGIIWQIDSARTNLSANFTFTPRTEYPYFTNSPFLEVNTTTTSNVVIAGSAVGAGGLTDYTTKPFMLTSRSGSGYNGSSAASFYVAGILNWAGGMHLSDGPVYLAATATVTIDTAYADFLGGAVNSFYIATNNITFNGPLYCTGKRLAPLVTNLTLNSFAPRNTAAGVDGGNANQYVTLNDFQPYNCGIDIYQRNYNGRIMYGSSKGMATIVQNPLLSGTGWQGVAILLRNVSHIVKDPAGVPIVGAKIYSIPTNDGNRIDLSAFGPALPIFNFTDAANQSWTTTAGGITTTQAVKLKGWWVNNTTTPANSSSVTRYTKGGDDTATYDFFVWAYGYLPATTTVSLNGIGTFVNAVAQPADGSITQSNSAIVAAYTELNTAAQVYDYGSYYALTNFVGQTAFYSTRSGSLLNFGAYNVTIDAAAVAPFALSGSTITIKASAFAGSITTTGNITNSTPVTGTISSSAGVITSLAANVSAVNLTGTARWDTQAPCVAQGGSAASGTTVRITTASSGAVADFQAFAFNAASTFENTSGQPITLLLSLGQTAPILLPTSGTITIANPVYNATATVLAGSRVQLVNTTTAVELNNVLVAGTSYSFALASGVTSGDVLTLRITKTGYLPASSSAVYANANMSFLLVQSADAVYNENAIDGSTVTEFSTDYVNIEIDISDPDNTTTFQRMYAWFRYIETTSSGIQNFYGAISATDTVNYLINSSVVDLKVSNVSSTPVKIVGGNMIRSDGETIIDAVSNSIQIDPAKAYIANSALIQQQLVVINDGVKNASLLIPHTTNLP